MFSSRNYILSNINTLNNKDNTDNIITNIIIYYEKLYIEIVNKLKKYCYENNIKVLFVNVDKINDYGNFYKIDRIYKIDMYIFLTKKINITHIKTLKKIINI